MKTFENHPIHLEIVKRVFPLSILFLCVYAPYSLFVLHDYFAGWAEVFALVVHMLLVSYYFKPENSRVICNVLIAIGFPVLIPWFFSGGPSGHALWWSPIYALWVSYFATQKGYFTWMGVYLLVSVGIVVMGNLGYFTLANTNGELLNILFATCISTFLIYFYEQIRSYYEELSIEESRKIMVLQDRYLNLLESAPDAILVFNKDHQIVLANLQAENVFGYSKKDLMACQLEQLIEIPISEMGDIQQLSSLFSPNGLEEDKQPRFRGKRKNGTFFSAEVNMSINEKERSVTATIRDISERVSMTNMLMKQNKQLENFTRMASHNLRGPVGNLHSLLYLYQEETDEIEKTFLMDKLGTVVANLEETLNDLLEMVRLSHNQKNEKHRITFESVFAKITQSFEPEIKHLNACVSANFGKAPEIEYAHVHLESIMQNLLSNALKYRSPERDPEIHFETAYVNGQTILTVTDNGSGINLNKNGHQVFGLHQTFHSNPDAKGLGLFITKSQIDSLGGEITVDSEEGVGTTFNIVFNKYTQHPIVKEVEEPVIR